MSLEVVITSLHMHAAVDEMKITRAAASQAWMMEEESAPVVVELLYLIPGISIVQISCTDSPVMQPV